MPRPLFLQSPYIYVFYGAGILIALREVVTRRLWRADTDRRIERGSLRELWAGTTVGVGIAILLPLTGTGMLGAPVVSFWVGIGLMLAGFLFRLYAMLTLGNLFSHRVAIKNDHTVVEEGPYRWVRHPSYTGAVVTYLGIGVATGNWLSVLAVLAGSVVGYGYRIRIEERALEKELEGYAEYAERTPYRLLPGLW